MIHIYYESSSLLSEERNQFSAIIRSTLFGFGGSFLRPIKTSSKILNSFVIASSEILNCSVITSSEISNLFTSSSQILNPWQKVVLLREQSYPCILLSKC
jgi:hypothetical protein